MTQGKIERWHQTLKNRILTASPLELPALTTDKRLDTFSLLTEEATWQADRLESSRNGATTPSL
jgi:hypothetical protein